MKAQNNNTIKTVTVNTGYSNTHIKNNVRRHLVGRVVQQHTTTHMVPADVKRALAGQDTGLVPMQVMWYTVDGIPVDELCVAEFVKRGLING